MFLQISLEKCMSSNYQLLKKTIKYHGVGSALHIVFLKAMNKILTIKILKCVILTKFKLPVLGLDPKLKVGFLNEHEIKNYFGKGYNDLPPSFAEEAIHKKDKCICIIDDNDSIAGYSWYSNKDTPSGFHHLNFSFDPSYIYTYKVFTPIKHRGKRLHSLHMNLALSHFTNIGFKGIICHIYSDNFDSLKSSYRMGFKDIGSIFVVEFLGKIYHYSPKSCSKYNICLK